ncbi:peptidase_S8 domain-containing protein [Pycnococcus provasolii]
MMKTTWWCCAAVLAVTTTTAMMAAIAAAEEEPPLSEKEISRNTEETVRKIHDAIDAASSTMARRRLLGNDGAPSTEVNLYESDCPKNLDDNGCEACVSAGCFWQPVDRFCGKDCMIMDTSCYGVAESWSAPCPDPNAKPNDAPSSTEVNLYESDCPKNLDDNGCEACVSAGCFWQPVDRFCGNDCMIMDTSCYGVAESWSAPCPDPNATKPTNYGGGIWTVAEEDDVPVGDPVFINTEPHAQHSFAPEPADGGDGEEEFELGATRQRRPYRRRRWGGYGGFGPVSTTNIITIPAPPPPPPAPPALIVSAAYQTAAAQQMNTLVAQQQGVSAASSLSPAARDCEWGPWSAWGPCSGAPGQEGLRYRSRVKLVQESNGGTCAGTAEQAQRCISGTRTL